MKFTHYKFTFVKTIKSIFKFNCKLDKKYLFSWNNLTTLTYYFLIILNNYSKQYLNNKFIEISNWSSKFIRNIISKLFFNVDFRDNSSKVMYGLFYYKFNYMTITTSLKFNWKNNRNQIHLMKWSRLIIFTIHSYLFFFFFVPFICFLVYSYKGLIPDLIRSSHSNLSFLKSFPYLWNSNHVSS